MPRHPSSAAARGFTLVELLCVLTISAILLAAAAPPFRKLQEKTQLNSATSVLMSHLLLARSEAAKSSMRVVVCKSADGASCTAAGTWDQGWIVFRDDNNNGKRDPQEQIIQRAPAIGSGVRVAGNSPVANYVSYASNGIARLTSGAFQAGTVTLCRTSMDVPDARQIVINAAGRPRVQAADVSACA